MAFITDEKDPPKEVYRPRRHDHTLYLQYTQELYECSGCKEPGFGHIYRCQECNDIFHKHCVLASDFITHDNEKSFFEFLKKGESGKPCTACGRDVKGFAFHCSKTKRVMHPLCQNLPKTLPGDGVTLLLQKSISSKCDACGVKKLPGTVKGWSYRSTCKTYEYHVSCVKDMLVNQYLEQENLAKGEMKNDLSSLEGKNLGEAEMKKNLYRLEGKNVNEGGMKKNLSGLECMGASPQLKVQKGASSSKGMFKKIVKKMVQVVLSLIVSAIIGDPTTLIGLAIHSLLFN